jgi:hypothetical protein
MDVILMSSIIAINIVAMTNSISIAVAQYNPYNPSTGHDTSSLSPPSTSSPSSPQSPSLGQSTSSPQSPSPPPNAPVVNTSSPSPPPNAPVVNASSPSPPPNQQPTKAPVVNSSTISSPPNPVIVGPSNFIASPITRENVNATSNATSSPPSEGLFLGSPGR